MAAVIAYMRPVARVPYTAHSKSGCSQVLNSRADGTVAASRLIMALRAETLRDYREASGCHVGCRDTNNVSCPTP